MSAETDFDDWLIATYREMASFTMLFVLVGITESKVDLLRSAYLHVIGDELRWPEMERVFACSGVDWSGAVFFRAGIEGLVADGEAKSRLAALLRKMNEDRTIIREGEFFNRDGLKLRLEEQHRH